MSTKTRKAAAKRFKVTAKGKVLRWKAGRRHLLSSKSAKRRHHLRQRTLVSEAETKRVLECLPFHR
ncbi:MAG: 50S ribosomal protein L35 [Verrucomicrobia bacterium]|nr:50S ribosomal protein L35 [Verrucomicrobiota bacterium]